MPESPTEFHTAMKTALELALRLAQDPKNEDVPVAALVMDNVGNVLGSGTNARERDGDPTAHAEIVAIREAARNQGTWRLDELTMVVTLEPCAMCAGAIAQARIKRVVFGAWDEKAGAVGSVWDVLRDPRAIYKAEVIPGVMQNEAAQILTDYFAKLR